MTNPAISVIARLISDDLHHDAVSQRVGSFDAFGGLLHDHDGFFEQNGCTSASGSTFYGLY